MQSYRLSDDQRYFVAPLLLQAGLFHFFGTRHLDNLEGPEGSGGVACGLRQVHGDQVIRVDDPATLQGEMQGDALTTHLTGVLITVATADCVPILLFDPVRAAISAVHAGWRGTLLGIVKRTVVEMGRHFGSRPSDLMAAIGPAIGPCCFEVGAEVWRGVSSAHQDTVVARKTDEKAMLDLPRLNAIQMEEVGLLPARIAVCDRCTACSPELFYSYRREGKTGRMISGMLFRGARVAPSTGRAGWSLPLKLHKATSGGPCKVVMDNIARRVACVRERIEAAALRAGRGADEITPVAASKGATFTQIREAWGAGIRVFGENRVQEAEEKFGSSEAIERQVHLIGPLQTNKVKQAVGFFSLIHSVDSIRLADAIQREAERRSLIQPVLVQVNLAQEKTKHGVSPQEVSELVAQVRSRPHLSLRGLMAIPPATSNSETTRPYFVALRNLGHDLGLSQFSMGMSSDFEVAIEEGATWVRLGTAIFGPRT
jgi:YfiH family protein/pyridoxal phosphate enzyme (YggS family)